VDDRLPQGVLHVAFAGSASRKLLTAYDYDLVNFAVRCSVVDTVDTGNGRALTGAIAQSITEITA
jgi:hypothetical protein